MTTRLHALAVIGVLTVMAGPAHAQQPSETTIVPTPAPHGAFVEGPTVEAFRGFPDLSASLGWGIALASAFFQAPTLIVPHVGATANWSETFREASQDGVGALPPGAFVGFAPAQLHVGFAVQVDGAIAAFRTIFETVAPTPSLKHEVSYQRSF